MAGEIKRYYRKHIELFLLLEKIKLWPSKNGILHGIADMNIKGEYAEVTTHCGETFIIRDSRNSRAARWLRNKWYRDTCPKCKVPDWKIKKYSTTAFSSHYGTDLKNHKE